MSTKTVGAILQIDGQYHLTTVDVSEFDALKGTGYAPEMAAKHALDTRLVINHGAMVSHGGYDFNVMPAKVIEPAPRMLFEIDDKIPSDVLNTITESLARLNSDSYYARAQRESPYYAYPSGLSANYLRDYPRESQLQSWQNAFSQLMYPHPSDQSALRFTSRPVDESEIDPNRGIKITGELPVDGPWGYVSCGKQFATFSSSDLPESSAELIIVDEAEPSKIEQNSLAIQLAAVLGVLLVVTAIIVLLSL